MSAPEIRKKLEVMRERLVRDLIDQGILKSEHVIRAFRRVPREEFVMPMMRLYAYYDTPLQTMHDQTISAPHMCAMMCELLELKPGMKVLEVGTGSGYHAALCAEAVAPSDAPKESWGKVISIEIVPELVRYAIENLTRTGYIDRVEVVYGDGGEGYPPEAPYDAILVTAAAPRIPPPLIEQLRPGGKLVIPVRGRFFGEQILYLVEKLPDGRVKKTPVTYVAFVEMRGKYAEGTA